MKKPKIIPILVSFLFILTGCQSHLVENQVNALLDETQAEYQLIGCSGGWVAREMYCEVFITKNELNEFIDKLGLNESLPYFKGEKRIIIVSDDQHPCSSKLRKKYTKAFGIQQWHPTRHGFASVILFYNKKTERGCLYLSIAYG
jgi:hypothetical protein